MAMMVKKSTWMQSSDMNVVFSWICVFSDFYSHKAFVSSEDQFCGPLSNAGHTVNHSRVQAKWV